MTCRTIGFGLLLVLCAARAAPADEPACSPQALKAAKEHFDRGKDLFDEGEYASALAEFEAAYLACERKDNLYGVCLSKKRLLRYPEALFCFDQYLAGAPPIDRKRRVLVDEIVKDMRAVLAKVQLAITPDGAAVTIDGRTVGAAPLLPIQLLAGPHVVEVTADGYRGARREFAVTAGEPLTMSIALEALPKSGLARITSSVPGSQVEINRKPAGTAPVEVELPIGGHRLVVTAPKYLRYQGELVIIGGERREVPITLEPLPAAPRKPVYKEWWPWTVGGTLLAGGAATAIILTWPIDCPQLGDLGSQCANVRR